MRRRMLFGIDFEIKAVDFRYELLNVIKPSITPNREAVIEKYLKNAYQFFKSSGILYPSFKFLVRVHLFSLIFIFFLALGFSGAGKRLVYL